MRCTPTLSTQFLLATIVYFLCMAEVPAQSLMNIEDRSQWNSLRKMGAQLTCYHTREECQ